MWGDPVLVGYDGSAGAGAAVRWALLEAARRGLPVRVLTVLDMRHATGGSQPLVEAESVLDKVVYEASAAVPGVEVTGLALAGPAARTLCELSRSAGLMVLGQRGLGGFTGLLVGSVSVAVAAHAHCPVVVVREEALAATEGPVLLGVDEGSQARLAAAFAFEEAALRQVGLLAVRALGDGFPHAHGYPWPSTVDEDDRVDAAQSLVDDVLDTPRRRHPQVTVTTSVAGGTPGAALSDASREAQLLVVGGRGRGGFRGLLLGSVSHQVLHHAHCPVAVVREGVGARIPA